MPYFVNSTIIGRFVEEVNSNPFIPNKEKFFIKLPYSCGGYLNNKKSTKSGKGVNGIVVAIKQFLKNHPAVLGFIPYIIVQPKFPTTTEAKVFGRFLT